MPVARGITRTVYVGSTWALKVPGGLGRSFVRGWLANRSEWKQRARADVAGPVLTLGHVVLVQPAAMWTYGADWYVPWKTEGGDEAKGSSWGFFGVHGWLLVDFDRAWQHPRGLVGRVYYGRQERLARRWSRPARPTRWSTLRVTMLRHHPYDH